MELGDLILDSDIANYKVKDYYEENDKIKLNAKIDDGWGFLKWGNISNGVEEILSKELECEININKDMIIKPVYGKINSTPNIKFNAIDGKSGKLFEYAKGMKYSVDKGNKWIDIKENTSILEGLNVRD